LEIRGASKSAKSFKIAFYVNSFEFIGLNWIWKNSQFWKRSQKMKKSPKKSLSNSDFHETSRPVKIADFFRFFGTTPSKKGTILNIGGDDLINWGMQTSFRGVMGKGVVF
jgi:hypothetical protein